MLGAATASTLGLVGAARAAEVETVVVTGSRIPVNTGLYTTSPVTTLGSGEMKFEGTTNLGAALNMLPAVNPDGDSQFTNNGSGGIATVDLRNLGPKRTLVLVDGKRLVAADTGNDIDLNQIPASMVERVEVLTGGASAVYGSDAVSGVVNIILRKDFEGMEVGGSFKETGDSDGQTMDVNVLMGANSGDGKGNVTIYGDYTDRYAVFQGARPYGAFALQSPTEAKGSCTASRPAIFFPHNGLFLCHGGSSLIAEGHDFSSSLATSGPATFGSSTMFTASRQLANYDGRTFNFAPFNYYQTPNTRWSFGAEAHYDVDNNLDFYSRLTFSDNRSRSQLAPTPIGAGFTVNFSNPLLSNQERDVIFGNHAGVLCTAPGVPAGCRDDLGSIFLGRRLVENGPRIQTDSRAAYQLVFGAKGDIPFLSDWSYDLSGQYGHTAQTRRLDGDASFTRFQAGLLSDTAGVCKPGAPAGCVPIDIFATGSISPAAVKFFTLSMDAIGSISEWDFQANANGNLDQWGLHSPWAKDPIGIALGYEYRFEASTFLPDDNLATGNLLGFNAEPPISGRFNVHEGYIEARVPIVQGMDFVKDLTFDGAFRYSDYNVQGHATTYKYGVEYTPIDDIKFRGAIQKAVRAPNVAELFAPVGTSANPGSDPCSAAGLAVPTTAALCIATGVPAAAFHTAALNCPSGQCEAQVGGNPLLKPEIADTRTFGLVFTPTFFDGFTATVDYYDVKISKYITGLPIQTLLNSCYSTVLNPAQTVNAACLTVHRDAGGRIFGLPNGGFVSATENNIGMDRVRGIDYEVNYQTDLDWTGEDGLGGIALNWRGNSVLQNDFQPAPGQPIIHCKGLYGANCGEPQPEFTSNTRLTWSSVDNIVSVSALWRYIDRVHYDLVVNNGKVDPRDSEIDAFNYLDLGVNWNVFENVTLNAGIQNVFDTAPPTIDQRIAASSFDSGNTFPNTYDPLGRTFFIGGQVKY